jgi:hypothetical protein
MGETSVIGAHLMAATVLRLCPEADAQLTALGCLLIVGKFVEPKVDRPFASDFSLFAGTDASGKFLFSDAIVSRAEMQCLAAVQWRVPRFVYHAEVVTDLANDYCVRHKPTSRRAAPYGAIALNVLCVALWDMPGALANFHAQDPQLPPAAAFHAGLLLRVCGTAATSLLVRRASPPAAVASSDAFIAQFVCNHTGLDSSLLAAASRAILAAVCRRMDARRRTTALMQG